MDNFLHFNLFYLDLIWQIILTVPYETLLSLLRRGVYGISIIASYLFLEGTNNNRFDLISHLSLKEDVRWFCLVSENIGWIVSLQSFLSDTVLGLFNFWDSVLQKVCKNNQLWDICWTDWHETFKCMPV